MDTDNNPNPMDIVIIDLSEKKKKAAIELLKKGKKPYSLRYFYVTDCFKVYFSVLVLSNRVDIRRYLRLHLQ